MILIIVVRWGYPGAVRTSSGAPRTGLVGAIADTSTTPGGERKLWGVFSVLFSSWSSWPPSQSEDSATQSLRTAVLGRRWRSSWPPSQSEDSATRSLRTVVLGGRWRWGWGQHANFSIVLSLCLQAPEKCDEVFGCQPEEEECYSINDVDSNIFTPDTRQALKVCGTGDCSEYADRGFACAPIWTCKDNRIITDGKVTSARLSSTQLSSQVFLYQGIIDVRTSVEEEEQGCRRNSGTIDVTDKKCPKTDEVCCKRPNYRAKQCELSQAPAPSPSLPESEWSSCGRNGTGRLLLSGSDDLTLAQPGEFPHMCVIYRSVCLSATSLQSPNCSLSSSGSRGDRESTLPGPLSLLQTNCWPVKYFGNFTKIFWFSFIFQWLTSSGWCKWKQ